MTNERCGVVGENVDVTGRSGEEKNVAGQQALACKRSVHQQDVENVVGNDSDYDASNWDSKRTRRSDLSTTTTGCSTPGSSSSSEAATGIGESGRTTLFVTGLPSDAKPRELYLMCRLMSGYEKSVLQVKSAKHNPVGFVTFTSRAQAQTARELLDGQRFDPHDARTLRVEFARKPTHSSAAALIQQQQQQPRLLLPHRHHEKPQPTSNQPTLFQAMLLSGSQLRENSSDLLLNAHPGFLSQPHQPQIVAGNGNSNNSNNNGYLVLNQHQLLAMSHHHPLVPAAFSTARPLTNGNHHHPNQP